MIRSFKDIKGGNITLVERSRAFVFRCTEATRINEFNLRMEGTADGRPPAIDKPWQIEFGGSSWGTSLEVTENKGKFLVKAETIITDPTFWE